jgi:hypothetical protein
MWVSLFESFTTQRATLLRVFASFYEGHVWETVEPRPEAAWREQWLKQVSEDLAFEGDWPWSLWLDFGRSPVPRLSCTSHGEGFELELDDEAPVPGTESGGAFVREFTSVAPFDRVVDTPLHAMRVLAWPPDDEIPDDRQGLLAKLRALSGSAPTPSTHAAKAQSFSWADRDEDAFPLGMCLEFRGGALWIFNIADELEIHDRRPSVWHEPRYEVREYSVASAR